MSVCRKLGLITVLLVVFYAIVCYSQLDPLKVGLVSVFAVRILRFLGLAVLQACSSFLQIVSAVGFLLCTWLVCS